MSLNMLAKMILSGKLSGACPVTWNRHFREKHLSSRERQLEKPASGAAAARGQVEGQKKKQCRMRRKDNEKRALEETRHDLRKL